MSGWRKINVEQIKWADGELTTTTNQSTQVLAAVAADYGVHVRITGTGTVSVTATVQGSNTGGTTADEWFTVGSALSLTGTNGDSKGLAITDNPYAYLRVTLASITGTGATAVCYVSASTG